MALLNKEPTIILSGAAEIVKAIIPLLIIFGYLNWSAEQTAQVVLVIGVIVGAIQTLLNRSAVVPTETANSQIKTALAMPVTATVGQVVAKTAEEAKTEPAN